MAVEEKIDVGMEPYLNLANAIILSAVKDYRTALRMWKSDPGSEIAMKEVKSQEKFFRSGWYEMLTDVDGEYLIRKLREEAGITKEMEEKEKKK